MMYSSLELTMGPSAPVAFASASSEEPLLSDTLLAINADPFHLEDVSSWPELDSELVRAGSGNAIPSEVYRSEFVGNELASFYPEHPELRSPDAWIMCAENEPEQSRNRGTTPSTSVDSSDLASPQEERIALPEPAAKKPSKAVKGRGRKYRNAVQYAPVPQEMDYSPSVDMEQGSSSSSPFVTRSAAVKAAASISATYSRQLEEDREDASYHVRGMSKSSKRKWQQEDNDADADADYDATKALKKRRISPCSGSKRARPSADGDGDWQLGAAQGTHRSKKRAGKSSSKKDKASEDRCSICPESFSRELDLFRHIKSKHEGEKHACTQCGELFSRKDALQRHQRKTCGG